jgi:predicted transcriptional regulator
LIDEDNRFKKPDLYVVARFLEKLWMAGQPIKKSRLQMSVGLNYGTFMRYLGWMSSRGLVTISGGIVGSDQVSLTVKGIESHKMIVNLINSMDMEGVTKEFYHPPREPNTRSVRHDII